MTSIDEDPFCEALFWQEMGINTIVTNPVAAATGLGMFVMACVPILDRYVQPVHVPFLFYVAKSTILITGMGTVVFHSVPLEKYDFVNVRDFDWIPIVLMGFAVALFFLSHDIFVAVTVNETGIVLACSGALLWMIANIMLMDSGTRPALRRVSGDDQGLMWVNVLVLLPNLIVLIRMVLEPKMRSQMRPGGLYLAASIVMWALNSALCRTAPWLAFLHAAYHVTVTMAYLIFISVAAVFISHERLEYSGTWWPRIVPKPKLDGAMWPRITKDGSKGTGYGSLLLGVEIS